MRIPRMSSMPFARQGLANQKGPRIQQVLRSITEERGSLDLSFLERPICGRGARLADEI